MDSQRKKRSDFDLDLPFGQIAEELVKALALKTGLKIEVKRDRVWKRTRNLYVESRCQSKVDGSWALSGIAVTKADYWAFVIERTVLWVPIDILKTVYHKSEEIGKCDILPNPSTGRLINIDEILEETERLGKLDEQ